MKWSLLELRRQSKVNWGARIAVIVGLLAGLWLIVGFFVLPPVVKSQAEQRLSRALRRPVTIERVQTNPLRLAVRVEGLVVREPEGGDFVSFRSLFINFSLWARLTGTWNFEEVALDGFTGRLAVGSDGRLNMADLLPPSGPSAPAEGAAEPAIPSIAIGRLAVSDARIDLSDQSNASHFKTEIGPLAFTLSDFHTVGDPRAPYDFTARTEAGEVVSWRGSLSLNPLRSEGEIAITGVSLPKYAPYYAPRIRFSVASGVASYTTRYTASLGSAPAVRLTGGEFTLKALQLNALNPAASLVSLPEVHVTGIEADLITRRLSLDRVALRGGQIDIRRTAGGIEWLQAFSPVPAAAAAPAAGTASGPASAPPPAVSVKAFSARELALRFSDATAARPAQFALDQVSLDVGDVSLGDLTRAFPVTLTANLGGGGALSVAGTLTPAPLQASLDVTLEGASVALASPYVESYLDLWIAKGRARAKGRLLLGAQGARFTGEAGLAEWVAVDNVADEEVLSWSNLSFDGLDFNPAENQLSLGALTWSDPSIRVARARDGVLNLGRLRRTTPGAPGTPTTAPAPVAPARSDPPLQVRIDRFQLERARVSFTDQAIQPAVKTALTGFSGLITGLSSSPQAQATVELKGKIDDAAPLSLTGRVSPLARPASADLKLDLRGADLTPAGPYVARYAGFALDRGSLSLAVQLRLANRRIESSDVATLDQFTLGAKSNSPDATKLPVSLAVALLKDRQGQIVIDIPIQGSLDDPEFRVGRVVWRVIGNLLTKAATSPFALLGAAFGGGGEELSSQSFAAGSASLAAAEQPKLTTLAKALVDRPGLRLELTGHYDARLDREALRQHEFERQIEVSVRAHRRTTGTAAEDTPVAETEQVAALARLYAEAFPEVVATQAAAAASTPPSVPDSERIGLIPRLVRFLSGRATPAPAPAAPATPTTAPAPTATPAPTAPALSVETMAEQVMAKIVIDDASLLELAAERAQHVRTRLLEAGAIAPERILLSAPAAGSPQVKLSLK
ncbi:MAG: DUF748 domain-containing protein [Opitutaceae bacterium]|nr:DUF748 domain-containing protein [Opitutaceae bacterium]